MTALTQQIVNMVHRVQDNPDVRGCLSTGERIAVAFVLDRMDWLKKDGWTPLQAADRLGAEWLAAAAQVQHHI